MSDPTMKIVLIDDDDGMAEMLKDFFTGTFPQSNISHFKTGEAALAATTSVPTAVILDYHLDSENADAMNGIQVLVKFKEKFNGVHVILLSAEDKPEIAIDTMKYGAYDYVIKNLNAFQRLAIILNKIASLEQLQQRLNRHRYLLLLLLFLFLLMCVKLFFFSA